MALRSCPECNHKVSDHAVTCPSCGFPLAQSLQPDLAKILCGGKWLAQSGTLVDAMLEAEFSPNYTFRGLTRPDPDRVVGLQVVARANFHGRWQVTGSQLFLDFPLTTLSGSAPTQIAIQFTRISDDSLSGVDNFLRGWEWEMVGTSETESVDEEAARSEILKNLDEMRNRMLKKVAEEEAVEGSRRKTRNKGTGS